MLSPKLLYDLQEVDLRLADLEQSLGDVESKLEDESAVVSARTLSERLQAQFKDVASERRRSESTASELQERLQKIESRLYGGAITNPRELSAAEDERNFIVGERSAADDALLELMVSMESIEAELHSAREALERAEASRPQEKADLSRERERLSDELVSVKQSRESLVPLLDAGPLFLYESLRKSKRGRAVAKVQRGLCQGCRMVLSTMELQRARSARALVQCGSCGRILYVV
jgi:predicted  nucleic acid-binding Zn-ribbon protein